jgi:2,4-dienoyl-CoA reductase-like NADH-dependent reductase (Old Yellow Enzyme family)
MADKAGGVTADLVRLYERLAAGGAALIVTGGAYVHPQGRSYEGCLGVHDDGLVAGLSELVEAVHRHSTPILLQLYHAGRQRSPSEGEAVAPSPVQDGSTGVVPRELTGSEIEELVEAFGDAAVRARKAGFDGIQVCACNGHLVHQFLSPYTNRRSDDWGGTPEKRRRFLLESTRNILERTGDGFIVAVKVAVRDHLPGGLNLREAVDACRALDALGISALEIAAGMYESGYFIARGDVPLDVLHHLGLMDHLPAGVRVAREIQARLVASLTSRHNYLLPYARAVRSSVRTPLMVGGGIRKREDMDRIIATGQADLITLSRPLVREPSLPDRLAREATDTAACRSCNRCTIMVGAGYPLRCHAGRTLTRRVRGRRRCW